MTTTSNSVIVPFLFHPFVRLAGASSLMLGLIAILLAGWLGHQAGLHFDGVLDAHAGARLPLWLSLSEGILNWLSAAIVLFGAGKLLSKTSFRAIDLFGTQAVARWPTLLASLGCFAPGFHRYTAELTKSLRTIAADPAKFVLPAGGADALVFALITVLVIICTVWMVALMWKSFSHCCNVRGGKAVAGFVVGLLLAEVLSKVLLSQLIARI